MVEDYGGGLWWRIMVVKELWLGADGCCSSCLVLVALMFWRLFKNSGREENFGGRCNSWRRLRWRGKIMVEETS